MKKNHMVRRPRRHAWNDVAIALACYACTKTTVTTTLLPCRQPKNGIFVTSFQPGLPPRSRRQLLRQSSFILPIQTSTRLALAKPPPPSQPPPFSQNNKDVSSSVSAASSTDAIPANLRRKVQAKRPPLGHVVPKKQGHGKVAVAAKVPTPPAQQQQQQRQGGGSKSPQLRPQGVATSSSSSSSSVALDRRSTSSSSLKIAGGVARGRKLLSPPVYLRPMMGKVKEAVYSTLTSFGLYDATSFQTGNHRHMGQPVRHLDIFAGSGSVGLESLSRGASHCTFVDLSTECCTCIQRNLEWTGLVRDDDHDSNDDNSNRHNIGTKDPLQQPQKRTALVCAADALVALREPQAVGIPAGSKYQIVTLCPPYEEVVYGELLEAVVGSTLVADNDAVVILEYPVELWGKFPHVLTVDNHTAVGVRNRRYGRTVIAMYVINPSGALSDAANSRPEEFVCL